MKTLECFEDLMLRLKEFPDYYEKRKQLAELLGVLDSTVHRWMTGSSPAGMSMISLRYYLDFLGYQVEELEKVSQVMQSAGKLLAFRVTTLEEMARYTGHEKYIDQVITVIRGSRGISTERQALFHEFIKAHQLQLDEVMSKLPRLIMLDAKVKSEVMVSVVADDFVTPAPILQEKTGQSEAVDSKSDEHFRCLTLMLLDYANRYVRADVSDEERDRLRQIVGQRKIFELKNVLVRLCGSTAFKQSEEAHHAKFR